jgi:DNA polymerase (family X)
MELKLALDTALGLVERLTPFCDQVEIAGSIRRRKTRVHDIDIVAIPNEAKLMSQGFFDTRRLVASIADPLATSPRVNGLKMSTFSYHEIPVDIYWATPQTWATLLLIRTGSKEHNIKLCSLAKQNGMHLHASGDGLFSNGERIAGDTEKSIFISLGLAYIEPERRN